MSRVRVLMLVDRLADDIGGGERAALALSLHLPRDRFDVTVCTTRWGVGAPIEELRAAGIRHVDLRRRGRFDVVGLGRLCRMLRREHFDVLHAHMFGSNVWGALLGRLCRVPVVVAHEQTWSYQGQPLRKALDFAIGRLVHGFIAVSTADARRMVSLERVPANKVVVIPNAWMPRRTTAPRGELRAELGVEAGAPVAATVAVFRRQKRLDVLLDAWARVDVPEARLVLVGGRGEEEAVRARAARPDVADRVHFAGLRQDVDAVWRAADLAVMSSDFEGTPLAALEAMAHGVPVVATEVGGLPDIVEQGVSGLLVPRRDAAALAAAISALLRDPERRRRMGEAARRRADEFSAERHATRCAELYMRLSRGGRAGRATPRD